MSRQPNWKLAEQLGVESDGDRYPKDVYICAGDGLGRIATIEGVSEATKFKLARFIVEACNNHAKFLRIMQENGECITSLTARVLELEQTMATAANNQRDSNGEVMRLKTERDALQQSVEVLLKNFAPAAYAAWLELEGEATPDLLAATCKIVEAERITDIRNQADLEASQ